MSRHWRILDFAVATLLRSPVKTVVIVIVYAFLVGVLASLLLYLEAHRREADRLLETAPEIVVQRLRGGRHELTPVSRAEPIRQIRGVAEVTPRVWGYTYDPPTGATFTLWGADSVPREALQFGEGEFPGNEALGGCVVGQGVADARFLGVGDRLPMKDADGELLAPRVEGVFTASSVLLTNDLVVMPTPMLRRVLGIEPGYATDLAVRVRNPNEVDIVVRKIQEMWPDVRSVTRRQIMRTYDAIFDWRGGLWAAVLMSSILAFSILVWDKASGLSAEEYRTVGVLKAVGWKSRDVMELKVWEGTIVSVISLLLGMAAAQVHLIVYQGAVFARVVKGWSVLFPAIDVTPRLDTYTVLVCLPLVVVPYVAASLLPTWRATVTDPDSVMRS